MNQFTILVKGLTEQRKQDLITKINVEYSIASASQAGRRGYGIIQGIINKIKRSGSDTITAEEMIKLAQEKENRESKNGN